MIVDVGVSQRACLGEQVCGDSYTIDVNGTRALFSVSDGLGHGPKAAEASQAFSDCVNEYADCDVDELMRRAHKRLTPTRGAAAAILRLDEAAGVIDFTGVGNIILYSNGNKAIHPVCAPGIVGHRLRKVLPFTFDMPQTALLAMCSDGISSRVDLSAYAQMEPQAIADTLLADHGKEHDDVTCVVIRYSSE